MRTILIAFLILFSGLCFSQKSHTVLITEKDNKTELKKIDGIGPFYFKNNLTNFKNELNIESIVNALKIYAVQKIELVGHCSVNELNKNKDIAVKRAELIKSLFIKFGIPEAKIKTRIENDKVPLDLKNSESELNKRVELWIM